MKLNKEKKAYVEPQITMFALAGDCPILGSVLKPSCKPTLLSTQFHKPI